VQNDPSLHDGDIDDEPHAIECFILHAKEQHEDVLGDIVIPDVHQARDK
jgi:hypothetical protein